MRRRSFERFHSQADERAACPEKRTVPLRNQGFFITLLETWPESASREYALG